MSQLLYRVIDKSKHIPVDEWDTEENPIPEEDRVVKSIKGELILPLHELFGNSLTEDNEEARQLDYFAMASKRSYNLDTTRNHICRYLNYFEKFYDFDHELLMIMYRIKIIMDYQPTYSIDNFIDDVNKYIIRNSNLSRKIEHFVNDNYRMKLSTNNNRTPNLQFNDKHAKILYEISLLMNMYIPLATHFMYVHFIKLKTDVQAIMLKLFDLCMSKYEQERGIYIYEKLYEMATSVINKSIGIDKQLWQKNLIRQNNPTTHIRDTILEIVFQIMPKYVYDKNIINFQYFSSRRSLKYRINL